MSLIRPSRSEPAEWMVRANSTCFSLRLPCGLSASSFDRISSELSGVRSSWLMLARNSDLYFEVSASCSAFSSSARWACSTSRFLASTCFFSFRAAAPFPAAPRWSRAVPPAWSSVPSGAPAAPEVSSCDCLSRPSVRMFAAMVLSTMPIDSISWSRKRLVGLVELAERGQLDHRLHLALEQGRQDDDVGRRRLAEARAIAHEVRRHVVSRMRASRRRSGRSGPRAARSCCLVSSRCCRR